MKLFGNTSILAVAAIAATVISFTSTAQAQETVPNAANVTVSNAFTLLAATPLEFGTHIVFRRGAGGGAPATVLISADANNDSTITNAGAANDDEIIESVVGNRASYTITGALPTTTLDITLPAAPVLLSCATCSGAEPDFSVDTFADDGGNGTVITDGLGAATFYVGATLSTVAGVNDYEDGLYTNNFDVTVSY